jgi:hypothetical protein
MPIVDADLVFRQSERMTDFDDGGGRMSTVVVLDGVKNNLFPDITDVDRLTGRVSLRKVFAAALNADTDTLLSAHVLLDVPPADAATSAVICALRGALGYDPPLMSQRSQAASYVQSCAPAAMPIATLNGTNDPTTSVSASWTGGGTTLTLSAVFASPSGGAWMAVAEGQVVSVRLGGVRTLHMVQAAASYAAVAAGTQTRALTVAPALPGSGAQAGTAVYVNTAPTLTSRFWGVAAAPGITGSGASSITVSSTWARVAPADPSAAYPTAEDPAYGINVLPWADTHGLTPVIRQGDAVLIHHSANIGPASVSNGQVVDTGRTVLARLRIIGNNGVEHYRATAGQTPVGSGATADLNAGTVTINDVSGFSQPVTIEHRIEEMALATTVGLTTIGINRALSRQYPAGTRVSSLLMSGDLQGRAADGFAQTAWTGVWQDTVIGGTPLGDYNEASYPITTNNAGAVTQRWAVIFTTTQAFRVVGEDLGEIGTGTTMSEYAPVNPATGQPFFRIPAAGWGSGWAAGNVYRFNTTGSNTPVWALRCVAPSLPTGADAVTLQLRGYVSS